MTGVLAGLALILVLGVSLAALSYALAMALPGEYLFAPVINSVALPLTLLSGIPLPMSFAPGWLNAISYANPFRYVVDALRSVFAGHFLTTSVLTGVGVVIGLAVVSVAVGTRAFLRHNA